MKVREIMSREVVSCRPDTNLAAAAALMWDADCGILPVVDDGKLAGVITDRDICIALGTRNRLAAEVPVRDVATHEPQTCAADADVHAAMAIMRRAKVRRLPVFENGKLSGMLALNDIVEAADRKHGDLDYEQVVNTLKAVSEHRPHKAAAAA
jgi:CBS domain-containing protein